MSVLGVGITTKSNLEGNPTVYVEYHECDRCGAEFRYYYKSPKNMEEVLVEVAHKLSSNGKEDLCHSCMNAVPADQLVMSI